MKLGIRSGVVYYGHAFLVEKRRNLFEPGFHYRVHYRHPDGITYCGLFKNLSELKQFAKRSLPYA